MTPTANKKGVWRSKLLLFALLITSFSSLVYEVVWSRELSHIFGTSAFAITTVLTVFMAGLALGAYAGGRIIDRIRRKYQFLAVLELLIGVSCILTLYALKWVTIPYFYLYSLLGHTALFTLSLFILSAAVLIIPTFLIGIAFPTVVKLYHREVSMIGASVGKTYMYDTLGGAAGSLLTGFLLIAAIGFFQTSVFASSLNIILGVLLMIAFRSSAFTLPRTDKTRKPIRDPVILALFFLSGFAALSFEVIWARYIALIYGPSIYSFSILLASFLTGLGVGSFVISRYIDWIKDKIVVFAMIELLIGIIGMGLVVLFPGLERMFMILFFSIDSYYVFNILLFLACFLVVLIPTMLMGATLPVISAAYADERRMGSDIGRLFSVNSFGAIFGSFFAGFVMIPTAGLVHASIFTGIIYIMIALAFIYYYTDDLDKNTLRTVSVGAAVLILLGFIFLFAFYDPDYSYKGVYYHGARQEDPFAIFQSSIETRHQLVYRANSPYGLVTVYKAWDDSGVWLKNNGKTDASLIDMMTQGMISHIPSALHEDPKDILQIGMGGGFSLASSLAYDEVERVDAVEIDPRVVEASATVLAPFNSYALHDPRTNMIVADGRNFLYSTDRTYDIIVSEPPNIWVSGVSSLFTVEYYRTVRDHLNEGGIFSQWYPRYEMNEYDYLIALNTLHEVFPYMYEYDLGGDAIVIASLQPLDPYGIDRERVGREGVEEDIDHILEQEDVIEFVGDNSSASDRNYALLTHFFARGPDQISEAVKDIDIVNTDDRPILEFSTMRNKYFKFET